MLVLAMATPAWGGEEAITWGLDMPRLCLTNADCDEARPFCNERWRQCQEFVITVHEDKEKKKRRRWWGNE